MKNIFYLALTAIALCSACSKKSTPPPSTTVVIGGSTYNTVVMGSQTWTAENYNGPGGVNYDNGANSTVNGKLYTITEARAISLPTGWRLPSAADYNNLLASIGAQKQATGSYFVLPGQALELMSTTGWTGTNGNNQSGFNAYPSGYYNEIAAQFLYEGQAAFFFINDTNPNDANNFLSLNVSAAQTEVYYFTPGVTTTAWSVRFVKDN